MLFLAFWCVWFVKQNWVCRRQKLLSSRRKTGMYRPINARLDKVQLNCFQQQKCWGYRKRADNLCWDSSWECISPGWLRVATSLILVWISSALLSPVNYTCKCPRAQLRRAATDGLMDLWEESRNSFRLSLNCILTQEFPFSHIQPEILAYYCGKPRCCMMAMSFAYSDFSGQILNIGTRFFWPKVTHCHTRECLIGINCGICGKVELRRKLCSWH